MFDKWRERFLQSKRYYKYQLIVKSMDNSVYFISMDDWNDTKLKNRFKRDKENKKINYGLTTVKEFEEWKKEYNADFNDKYKQLKKFVKKQDKTVYIHLSQNIKDKIKMAKKNISFSNPTGEIPFNPPGIWFACDLAWLDFAKKHYININPKIQYFFRLDWIPKNAYIINIDGLNIKKIETCKELVRFSKKYMTKDGNYLDRKRIKNDFDGLLICPYLGLECNDYIKKNKNYFGLIEDYFLGKVSQKDRDIFWSFSWDAASGVVFKNYDKIKYEKFNFKS